MFIDTCGVGCVNQQQWGLDAGLDLESKATEMDEERRLLMRITGKSFSIAI